jgi:hypothetical protein
MHQEGWKAPKETTEGSLMESWILSRYVEMQPVRVEQGREEKLQHSLTAFLMT